jgi:PKD repeat protein
VVTASNAVSELTATTAVLVEESVAGLAAVNDSPTELGEMTTLTATVLSGTNVVVAWDFGDGMAGSGWVVTHTYAWTGTYTVIVTASNAVSVQVAMTVVWVETPPLPAWRVYLPLVARGKG